MPGQFIKRGRSSGAITGYAPPAQCSHSPSAMAPRSNKASTDRATSLSKASPPSRLLGTEIPKSLDKTPGRWPAILGEVALMVPTRISWAWSGKRNHARRPDRGASPPPRLSTFLVGWVLLTGGPLGKGPGNHLVRFPWDPSRGTKHSAERSDSKHVHHNNFNGPVKGSAA